MNDRFWDDMPSANSPQNPYAPTASFGDVIPGMVGMNSGDETIRRKFLNHEASVQSMGLLYVLGGVLTTVGGAGFLILTLITIRDVPIEGFVVAAVIGSLYLSIGVFQWWVGLGLRKLNPPARTCGIVLSCIGLLAIPLGTLISGYFLYLLASSKGQYVFSPEYTRIRKATPQIRYKTSIWIWVAAGVCALCVILVVSLVVLAG